MISASHNPPEDNGLKGFNSVGEKLSEEEEEAVEAAFEAMWQRHQQGLPPDHITVQAMPAAALSATAASPAAR